MEREAAPGSGQSSRERARFKTLRKGAAVGFNPTHELPPTSRLAPCSLSANAPHRVWGGRERTTLRAPHLNNIYYVCAILVAWINLHCHHHRR